MNKSQAAGTGSGSLASGKGGRWGDRTKITDLDFSTKFKALLENCGWSVCVCDLCFCLLLWPVLVVVVLVVAAFIRTIIGAHLVFHLFAAAWFGSGDWKPLAEH